MIARYGERRGGDGAVGSKGYLLAEVTCRGKKLDPERKVYILLNKPKDCFTTDDRPSAGRTVLDAVEGLAGSGFTPPGGLATPGCCSPTTAR